MSSYSKKITEQFRNGTMTEKYYNEHYFEISGKLISEDGKRENISSFILCFLPWVLAIGFIVFVALTTQ